MKTSGKREQSKDICFCSGSLKVQEFCWMYWICCCAEEIIQPPKPVSQSSFVSACFSVFNLGVPVENYLVEFSVLCPAGRNCVIGAFDIEISFQKLQGTGYGFFHLEGCDDCCMRQHEKRHRHSAPMWPWMWLHSFCPVCMSSCAPGIFFITLWLPTHETFLGALLLTICITMDLYRSFNGILDPLPDNLYFASHLH